MTTKAIQRTLLTLIASFCLISLSCEEIAPLIEPEEDSELSDSTIASGLKKALEVGTDTAVSRLNVEDGYFRDEIVKILLPDQLETAIANLKAQTFTIPVNNVLLQAALGEEIEVSGETIYNDGFEVSLLGIDIEPLSTKEDELILGINRAAEAAAEDAKPIFVNAITNMTITDAKDILFGTDSAATEYLETNTRTGLFTNFEPKIDSALNSVNIGEKTVDERYTNFVEDYNGILNTNIPLVGTLGSLADMDTITEPDLSDYATNKALDGLFTKVQDEEKDIRDNPLARVTDLLEEVFGELDI